MFFFSQRDLLPCALAAVMLAAAADAGAQSYRYRPPSIDQALATAPVAPAPLRNGHNSETLHILVGQSTILRGTVLKRIYVANPAVLQTFNSAPDEVVVTAKAPGSSSLILWDAQGHPFIYNVSADFDPLTVRAALDSEFPGNKIEVQGNQDLLTLTGTAETKEAVEAAGKLAASYAKNVANSIRVTPARRKQVELKLEILEVDRTKMEQFGFNLFRAAGNNVGGLSTQQFASTATLTRAATGNTIAVTDPMNLFFFNFAHNIGATIQDLEQKNVVQILAEPTLTAMSGQQARFLSGGEFPFPIVEGGTGNSTAITIQFRQYGVKMDFTPTVNDDGTIHMKVSPEVSALDYANAVTISGYTIPALSTRRAETEVEVRDGQSFAISGLLDHRTTEILSKMPGIGDVPLLGQLFHSKNVSHSVIELVVIVRAHVLDPGADAAEPEAPAWAVPNLTPETFDKALHRERPNDVPPLPNPVHLVPQP